MASGSYRCAVGLAENWDGGGSGCWDGIVLSEAEELTGLSEGEGWW